MLILNKEKENELIKYGFEKNFRSFDDSYYFKLGKGFTIEGFKSNKTYNLGKITMSSLSTQNQDVIYELIKNDILIKIENPKNLTSPFEKAKIIEKIEQMEDKIKDLEEKINDNSRAE